MLIICSILPEESGIAHGLGQNHFHPCLPRPLWCGPWHERGGGGDLEKFVHSKTVLKMNGDRSCQNRAHEKDEIMCYIAF